MSPAAALTLAKQRLTIMDAWLMLSLPGRPKVGMNKSPFRDDRNPSFSIYRSGQRWRDFGTGDGGSVVDFVMKAGGLPMGQAIEQVIRMAGVGNFVPPLPPPMLPKRQPSPASVVWSEAIREVWAEGVKWLQESDEVRWKMSLWRGWDARWVDALNEGGLLGCPLLQDKSNQRGTAFSVIGPNGNRMEAVGYHVRRRDGGWRYEPKGIRAFPFIMGCPHSGRLIITEGQWDAITLAGVEGWLDRHEAWPEDICVMGIRGASGTGAFWDAYGPIISKTKPDITIIRDGDKAGENWRESFAPELAGIVGRQRVRLYRMDKGKDINEAHKNDPLTPMAMREVIKGDSNK